jgi:hypothetical protein
LSELVFKHLPGEINKELVGDVTSAKKSPFGINSNKLSQEWKNYNKAK